MGFASPASFFFQRNLFNLEQETIESYLDSVIIPIAPLIYVGIKKGFVHWTRIISSVSSSDNPFLYPFMNSNNTDSVVELSLAFSGFLVRGMILFAKCFNLNLPISLKISISSVST